MPDLDMCTNIDCKLDVKCYRRCARPSTHQYWSFFEPKLYANECTYFIPVYEVDFEKKTVTRK